jgi:hypothetical protein
MKLSSFLKLPQILFFIMIFGVIHSGSGANLNRLNPGKLKDSTLCLEIKGKLAKTGNKTKSTYTVELVYYNTVVEKVNVKEGHSFKFFLKEDSWYSIRILENNCMPKLISISTKIPAGIDDNYFYSLAFVVDELISDTESKELDTDALDFPIAIFDYDLKLKEFNYNEIYAKNIKKKLCGAISKYDDISGQ